MKNKKTFILILTLSLLLALALFIIFVGPSFGIDVGVYLKKLLKITPVILTAAYTLSWRKLFKSIFSVCFFPTVFAADIEMKPLADIEMKPVRSVHFADKIEVAPDPVGSADNIEVAPDSEDSTETIVGSLGEEISGDGHRDADVGKGCCLISCLVCIGEAMNCCGQALQRLFSR